MVERVLITPTLMRLKNASGNIIFDTGNKYIRTDSTGTFKLDALTASPCPSGANILNGVMGGTVVSVVSSSFHDTAFSYTFTPPADGYLDCQRHLGIDGDAGQPIGGGDGDSNVFMVKTTGDVLLSRRFRLTAMREPGTNYVIGLAFNINNATNTVGTLPFPVTAGTTYTIYKTADTWNGNANYGNNLTFHMYYYSNTATLPLKVAE